MTTTKINGLVIGLVKDVDDPDGEGRVRVAFPWLGSDDFSGWAPIAAPLGGKDRGYYYLPEIDDEALVAFEFGDIDHPFVIGFLHNGVDKPPTQGIDKHVRRVKSVSGHVFDLDDRSGREKVQLTTKGGHTLDMRDGDSTVNLETSGGQAITMQDSPAQITITTVAGTTIQMTDAPSEVDIRTVTGVSLSVSDNGVTVTSASMPVTVDALQVTVNASAAVTVNAPAVTVNGAAVTVNSALATFSGAVICNALVAQSVVSASYTPGVGNIW